MKVRLGDYIKEYSVRNMADEKIPVYSVTNTKGFCSEYFSKDVASKDRSTYKIVPRGYFAYNPSRINVGSIDFLRDEARVIVSPLYVVFKTTSFLDNQYLLYYLKSDISLHYIKELATGSVRDNLKFSILSDFPIELRTHDEQISVVNTLKRIESLIALYQSQIRKLDELVKARFVEMFGNPVVNPMKWKEMPLKECLYSIDNGKSFVCANEPRQGDWPAILKLSAVTYGDFRPKENKSLLKENQYIEAAEVHTGDLLFTRKNTPELVGMATYVKSTPKKLMLPDLIFRLNTKENCSKIFLWHLINHKMFRGKIQNLASGSAKSMSNISKERLFKLNIVLPPIEFQEQFATFVTQVDKSKVAVQQALDKTRQLFDSLMQQYFG